MTVSHFIVGYLILHGNIVRTFSELEQKLADDNIARVRGAVLAESTRLDELASRWVTLFPHSHDDLGNHHLLDDNGLSWVLSAGPVGLIDWEHYQAEATQPPDPAVIQDLAARIQRAGSVNGIVPLDGRLALVSGTIGSSEAGSVIVGRWINGDLVSELATRTGVALKVAPVTEPAGASDCPPDFRCDLTVFDDLDGGPVLTLSIQTPADISDMSGRSMDATVVLLAFAALFFLGCIVILMRHLILQPVSGLMRHIQAMAWSKKPSQRLNVSRDDEIGAAADDLNRMTENLEKADTQLRYMAFNDSLTGLPNRVDLERRLARILSKDKVQDPVVTLLFINLDRFKHINDSLSHSIGDKLLIAAAKRLQRTVRTAHLNQDANRAPGDLLARVGGDEFVLALFAEIPVNGLRAIAQRVIETIEKPFNIDGETLRITASIGLCSFPRDGQDEDTLLRQAGIAMSRAKESGGGSYHFYNSALDAAYHERIQLELDLRYALDNQQLEVHYQPQFDTRVGRIIGCEALIRWNHPEHGMVSPADFVPLAEENGMIEPIGRWALKQACRDLNHWRENHDQALKVSVNVSPKQFLRGDLFADVKHALERNDMDGDSLVIELTESSVVQHPDEVVRTLNRLKSIGVAIAMDDFGTGYSSLSYLRRLPIDIIKIDRSFVEDLTTDEEDAALITAIIAMSQGLNKKVLAEGVETTEQMLRLQQRGCYVMQGYLCGKPMPAGQFERLLSPESGDLTDEPDEVALS